MLQESSRTLQKQTSDEVIVHESGFEPKGFPCASLGVSLGVILMLAIFKDFTVVHLYDYHLNCEVFHVLSRAKLVPSTYNSTPVTSHKFELSEPTISPRARCPYQIVG